MLKSALMTILNAALFSKNAQKNLLKNTYIGSTRKDALLYMADRLHTDLLKLHSGVPAYMLMLMYSLTA